MPYKVIISPRAIKDLKRLPEGTRARIISSLEQIQDDPIGSVNRLTDSSLYSLHVGEYRVILDILQKTLLVLVIRVGHRRNIYQKIP